VFKETARCEATSVDPMAARRGASLPAVLQRTWGHTCLGFYASAVSGGEVAIGDSVRVIA